MNWVAGAIKRGRLTVSNPNPVGIPAGGDIVIDTGTGRSSASKATLSHKTISAESQTSWEFDLQGPNITIASYPIRLYLDWAGSVYQFDAGYAVMVGTVAQVVRLNFWTQAFAEWQNVSYGNSFPVGDLYLNAFWASDRQDIIIIETDILVDNPSGISTNMGISQNKVAVTNPPELTGWGVATYAYHAYTRGSYKVTVILKSSGEEVSRAYFWLNGT